MTVFLATVSFSLPNRKLSFVWMLWEGDRPFSTGSRQKEEASLWLP